MEAPPLGEGAPASARPPGAAYNAPVAEPQIRYCTTTDGVSIAYYAMGEGETLLIASTVALQQCPVLSRCSLPEHAAHWRGHWPRDARRPVRQPRHRHVRPLGTRLLPRGADPGHRRRRREARPDRRSRSPAISYGCLAAIEYAARNPDKVSKLVLVDPVVDGADMRKRVRRWDSLRDMAHEEWEDYTNTMAAANVGYDRPNSSSDGTADAGVDEPRRRPGLCFEALGSHRRHTIAAEAHDADARLVQASS